MRIIPGTAVGAGRIQFGCHRPSKRQAVNSNPEPNMSPLPSEAILAASDTRRCLCGADCFPKLTFAGRPELGAVDRAQGRC
jgi:hypothetical protein